MQKHDAEGLRVPGWLGLYDKTALKKIVGKKHTKTGWRNQCTGNERGKGLRSHGKGWYVCVGGCGSLRQLRSLCGSDSSSEYCRGAKHEGCSEDDITYRKAIKRVELRGMVEVDLNHRHRIPHTVWEVHSAGNGHVCCFQTLNICIRPGKPWFR